MMSWGMNMNTNQYNFGDVSNYFNEGIDFCCRYELFLQKRYDIENTYAKELKNLLDRFEPEPDVKKSYEMQSHMICYKTMLSELRNVAGQHKLIAENIHRDVISKLNQIILSLKDDQKRCINDNEKITMGIINSEKGSEKTNAMNSFYFQTQLPQIFNFMQNLEIKRINSFKNFICDTVRLEQEAIPMIGSCYNNILTSAHNINPVKDAERVYMCKSGLPSKDKLIEEYNAIENEIYKAEKLRGKALKKNNKTLEESKQTHAEIVNLNNKISYLQNQLKIYADALNDHGVEDRGIVPSKTQNQNDTIFDFDQYDSTELKKKLLDNIKYIKNQIKWAEKSGVRHNLVDLKYELENNVDALKEHDAQLNNNLTTLANQKSSKTYIYQSPSQYSVTSSSLNNLSVQGKPISHHRSMTNLAESQKLTNSQNQSSPIFDFNKGTMTSRSLNLVEDPKNTEYEAMMLELSANKKINKPFKAPAFIKDVKKKDNDIFEDSKTPIFNFSQMPPDKTFVSPSSNQKKTTDKTMISDKNVMPLYNTPCVHSNMDLSREYLRKQQNQAVSNDTENYAVSSINQTNNQNNQNHTPSLAQQDFDENYHDSSFDEDDEGSYNLDDYCEKSLKAAIICNLGQYNDSNSFSETKEIMYADSQDDQVDQDSVQGYQANEGQQTSSSEDTVVIGNAVVKYAYKNENDANILVYGKSALDIEENERLSILFDIEREGWTLVLRRTTNEQGYVPTEYLQSKTFFIESSWIHLKNNTTL